MRTVIISSGVLDSDVDVIGTLVKIQRTGRTIQIRSRTRKPMLVAAKLHVSGVTYNSENIVCYGSRDLADWAFEQARYLAQAHYENTTVVSHDESQLEYPRARGSICVFVGERCCEWADYSIASFDDLIFGVISYET